MSFADQISWLMILVVTGLVAWYFLGDRRSMDPSDMDARRRRFKMAWELRGVVAVVAGPYAAGMLLGYVSSEYAVPLTLFLIAGLLVAEAIAPNGLRIHR